MAARVRSDCRIVRVGAGTRTNDLERIRAGRYLLPIKRKNGRVERSPEVSTRWLYHGRADRQGPKAASSPSGHEHEDQGPRA